MPTIFQGQPSRISCKIHFSFLLSFYTSHFRGHVDAHCKQKLFSYLKTLSWFCNFSLNLTPLILFKNLVARVTNSSPNRNSSKVQILLRASKLSFHLINNENMRYVFQICKFIFQFQFDLVQFLFLTCINQGIYYVDIKCLIQKQR